MSLVAAGCGGRARDERSTRDDPVAVARRALDALVAGDLARLHAEMDAGGKARLAADLAALRTGLGEPADEVIGVADEVRRVFEADGERLRVQASRATDAELLRFLARVRPPSGGPRPDPDRPATAERASYVYADVHAVHRPLRLVRGSDGWRLSAIGL